MADLFPPPPPANVFNVQMVQPAPNPVTELWKEVKSKPQNKKTLFEFMKDMKDYLVAKNLLRMVQLDLDPAEPVERAVIVPNFNWELLPASDQDGDRLARHIILSNLDLDIKLTVENLQHASQVWRALEEVFVLLYVCVLWRNVEVIAFLIVPWWGKG